METRALAIALFYAVGTAVGGISGPLLFGQFIHSGNPEQVATGFLIGAAAMALGGIAELRYGVRAEQRTLEDIAAPLSTAEPEEAAAAAAAVAASQRDATRRCASASAGVASASARACAATVRAPATAAPTTHRACSAAQATPRTTPRCPIGSWIARSRRSPTRSPSMGGSRRASSSRSCSRVTGAPGATARRCGRRSPRAGRIAPDDAAATALRARRLEPHAARPTGRPGRCGPRRRRRQREALRPNDNRRP